MTTKQVERPPKPITASERKALEKLLDEDFGLLRADLQRLQQVAMEQATAAVEREQKAHITRARKLEDQFRQQIIKLADEGFVVEDATGYGKRIPQLVVTSKHHEKALEVAERGVTQEWQLAQRILQGKQHIAKRELIKATVSAEALVLLEQLPTREQILEAVAIERQAALGKGA